MVILNQVLPPLMYSYYDTEYLGAAHGLCAILQMLITVPGYIEQCSPDIVKDIKGNLILIGPFAFLENPQFSSLLALKIILASYF